jgi:hypothetical protein
VEEQGYIEVKIDGLVDNKPLKPIDIDIAEIKEIISDVETFLYPTRDKKAGRPHISYRIEEGSARNLFYLPISGVLLFNGLSTEIKNRGNIDFLENKSAEIIDKFQRRAAEKNLEISFYSSSTKEPILKINKDTSYFKIAATHIETEFVCVVVYLNTLFSINAFYVRVYFFRLLERDIYITIPGYRVPVYSFNASFFAFLSHI